MGVTQGDGSAAANKRPEPYDRTQEGRGQSVLRKAIGDSPRRESSPQKMPREVMSPRNASAKQGNDLVDVEDELLRTKNTYRN